MLSIDKPRNTGPIMINYSFFGVNPEKDSWISVNFLAFCFLSFKQVPENFMSQTIKNDDHILERLEIKRRREIFLRVSFCGFDKR